MCMPRLIIPETYIAQLIPDPTFKPLIMPLRKAHSSSGLDVVAPPSPVDPDRPVYPAD